MILTIAEEMYRLREKGFTYQEIADDYDCSRQNVWLIVNRYKSKVLGIRGHGFYIENIIYKGIYEHFRDNLGESLTSFAEKVFGYFSNNVGEKMRYFIGGYHEAKFTIPQIKKMCEATGKTFEELFEVRK